MINRLLSNTLSKTELLYFTEQLYWFLHAGMTLSDAFNLLATHCKHRFQLHLFISMQTALLKGDSLSVVLSRYPQCFTKQYCCIIAAGEKCGNLLTALQQIIRYEKLMLSFYSKIKKALIYPTCVFVFSLIMGLGLLLFVVPQFQQMYANLHASLPALTILLIHFSALLHHVIALLLLLASLSASIILLTKNQRHHQLIFKLPFISTWLNTLLLIQWATLMTTLLKSSISLLEALTTSQHILFYKPLALRFNHVIDDIKSGMSLSESLKQHHLFTPQTHHYIAIGETTETLSAMLDKLSHHYQSQCDNMTDHLSKWIEPVMMLWVSSMIAVLLIALYLPIFNMGNIL